MQARRLRFRLRDYYGALGQSDSIRIEVPTGGYVALFQRQTGERAFTSDSSGRLPVPRTPLVGRTHELEEVTELVMDPDVRLLTLSGAGGSGKTRLALEAARAVTDEFAGGVLMLPLAPFVDPGSVVTVVGQMLGLRQTGGRATADALRAHVARSIAAPTLLVLDNFEHVLVAAPIVADLLDASAHVKLLVTSRAVLRVYGEYDYPVPPLTLPHPAAALAQLECNPAVRLFTQRAEAAQHGFALTAQNAAGVAEICRRLDGLPLAIELAAAHAKVLPVEGILARLPQSLDFLTGGARERPARQQTLRNTIDWSHRLLSPAEQRLFRRLAIFAGGWTLEGAEAVCNAHRDLEIDAAAGIASLVEKSLVQHAESFDGEARYRMLETLREYAFEQMRLLNEDGRTRRAHAAYCIVIAEEGNRQLMAAERGRWMARCDLEHDNFRAALDWVIATGDADWAFRLGLALYAFWERREHLVEGRQRLEAIVNLDGAEALADAGHTRSRTSLLWAGSEAIRQPCVSCTRPRWRRFGRWETGKARRWRSTRSDRFSGSTASTRRRVFITSRP